ncbi:hypothetical protein ACFSGI_17905 [Paenibacillus nicotianae]|uniref:Uncharacterized protein n=1 Tax=Paenibacillus nicotianae TaxID=1526551 RepID=A0ABW4UXY1_9BACL
MRKIGLLIYLVPLVVISMIAWNDYADEIEEAQNNPAAVHNIFYLDEGRKLFSIADGEQGLQGMIYTTSNHQLENTIPLVSNIFKDIAVAYQNKQLIVATKDNNDRLSVHAIDSTGNSKELANRSIIINDYLKNSTYMWRNRIVLVNDGWTKQSKAGLTEIQNGQLHSIDLSDGSVLPARPTNVDTTSDSFESDVAIPMLVATLKDGTSAYISGILDKQYRPSVYLPKSDSTSYEEEEQAQQQFVQHFQTDPTRLLQVENDYPKQVHFYNQSTDQVGALLPTPQPVYQAQIVLLNDQEALITGSTTKDEADGKLLGYIYNEKTKQFTDVAPLLTNKTYDQVTNDNFTFYKENITTPLYYSDKDTSAGWFNPQDGSVSQITNAEVEQWQANDPANQKSWRGFLDYLLEGGPIVFNLIIWLIIPFLLLIIPFVIQFILRRRKANQLQKGIVTQATIIARAETGTYINEQPQVQFTVQFEDEGVLRKVNIKKVVSYLQMPSIGDSAMISYDRRKQTAIFLTTEDVPTQPPSQILYNAVLQKIDTYEQVNRGQALLLHFELDGQTYSIPVVQPNGFQYRLWDKANLIQIAGMTRLLSYGVLTDLNKKDELTLQGEIISIQPFPVRIQQRQLMLMEVLVSQNNQRIQKVSSQFVPSQLSLSVGNQLPVTVKQHEFQRDLRLMQGKQGSAKVIAVEFNGTTGERPLARITVERGNAEYTLEQSIEPVYGVEVGDELWIAYDEQTREAMIVKYASM